MPRPELEIYEPRQGPEPMVTIPYQANLGAAFFRTSLGIASQVVGMTNLEVIIMPKNYKTCSLAV